MKNYFQNKLDVFKSNFQSKKNGVDFASKNIYLYFCSPNYTNTIYIDRIYYL